MIKLNIGDRVEVEGKVYEIKRRLDKQLILKRVV
jgi:hypothetical protein